MADKTHDAWEYHEESITDDYMGQAFDALLACGDSKRLRLTPAKRTSSRTGSRADRRKAVLETLVQGSIASQRRLMYARTAILFTALAAEAQINHFLYLLLPEAHVAALERLRTPDKYLVGPRLAMGDDLFARDKEPMGRLTRLFTLRNALAHPTTQRHRVKQGRFVGPGHPAYKDYNPETAASFLIAVSQAGVRLSDAHEATAGIGGFARNLLDVEKDFRDTAKRFRDELPNPPTLAKLLREQRKKGLNPPE